MGSPAETLSAPGNPAPIYFSQVREDSRIECQLVRAHGARRVVCVASGGCTALSLLAEGVQRVDAVDANPSQAALVELKKAAIRRLAREQYLDFVERDGAGSRWDTYLLLRATLPDRARVFWDGQRAAIELGINRCGVTEAFYRFVGSNVVTSVLGRDQWKRLMQSSSPAERTALHRELCETDGFRTALRVLLSRTTHLAFYPGAVFDGVSEQDFGEFFLRRLALEVRARSLQGNYFLSQFLFGEYLFDEPDGCPAYLDPTRYESVRRNLDSLHVHAAGLDRYLGAARGYDAIFLSNVFDWAPADERERIARAAVVAGVPGALVLFRQMLAEFPLPEAFVEGLAIDVEASERSCALERSLLYRSVTLGRVREPAIAS